MLLSVVEDIYLIWQKALNLFYINRKIMFLKKKREKEMIIYFKTLIHQDLISIWRDGTVKREEMFTNTVGFLF